MHTFVDGVKRSLSEHPHPLSWRRVTLPELDVAWVGMNVPSIDTGGRPWVWEVVTPAQYEASTRLQGDPMVLSVPQDMVVVEIAHADLGGSTMRMQVPVRQTPEAIGLDIDAERGFPWTIRLETGWSAQSLGSAAQCWIDREAPGSARLDTPAPLLRATQRYTLNPNIDIEAAAFDLLLTLDLDEAAAVTSLLSKVHEALAPYR